MVKYPVKTSDLVLLAVACVLVNWDNVLRAISMASSKSTLFDFNTGPFFIRILTMDAFLKRKLLRSRDPKDIRRNNHRPLLCRRLLFAFPLRIEKRRTIRESGSNSSFCGSLCAWEKAASCWSTAICRTNQPHIITWNDSALSSILVRGEIPLWTGLCGPVHTAVDDVAQSEGYRGALVGMSSALESACGGSRSCTKE